MPYLVCVAVSLAAAASSYGKWLKIAGPTFTIVTDVDRESALEWAHDFSQFTRALGRVVPVDPARLPPLTVVLFKNDATFENYHPMGPDGKPMDVGGFFARLQGSAIAAFALSGMDEHTRRTFFHEGAHWYLSGLAGEHPVWAEEGIAEVFSTFEVEDKHLVLGQPVPNYAPYLASNKMLPLDRFLHLTNHELHLALGDDYKTATAYAQCWAFMHMLFFGKNELPENAFSEYLKLRAEIHPDEAFQRAMGGKTYAQVYGLLKDYLVEGKYRVARIPRFPPEKISLGEASEADRLHAFAMLATAGSRSELAAKHVDELLTLAPEDPRGYAARGLHRLTEKNFADAVEAFEGAIARKSTDFSVYYQAAIARTNRALELGGVPPKEARAIANRYKRCINANPVFEPAYALLASVLANVEGDISADTPFLEQGRRIFPHNNAIALGVAVCQERRGNREDALMLALAVARNEAADKKDRNRARKLFTVWSPKAMQDEVAALKAEGRLAEALQRVEAKIAAVGDDELTAGLARLRDSLRVTLAYEDGLRAEKSGDSEAAQRHYRSVIESAGDVQTRERARRRLRLLLRGDPDEQPASTDTAPADPSQAEKAIAPEA